MENELPVNNLSSFRRNLTVKKMPVPLADAAAAVRVSQDKTEQALQKVFCYIFTLT